MFSKSMDIPIHDCSGLSASGNLTLLWNLNLYFYSLSRWSLGKCFTLVPCEDTCDVSSWFNVLFRHCIWMCVMSTCPALVVLILIIWSKHYLIVPCHTTFSILLKGNSVGDMIRSRTYPFPLPSPSFRFSIHWWFSPELVFIMTVVQH
jgi:hypothetical protein